MKTSVVCGTTCVATTLVTFWCAYWGIPAGALSAAAALFFGFALVPPRQKSVLIGLFVILFLACLTTYLWQRKWSPFPVVDLLTGAELSADREFDWTSKGSRSEVSPQAICRPARLDHPKLVPRKRMWRLGIICESPCTSAG